MKFDDAIHSCKCGAFIRDESGTMQAGWKIMFVPDPAPIRNPAKRRGDFYYVNPITGSNYLIYFNERHRASDQWRTTP